MKIEYRIPDGTPALPVKTHLKQALHFSTRLIAKLKRHQGLFLNGLPARTIDEAKPGDVIQAVLHENEPNFIEPLDMPINIIYEDEWLIAVNKEPGLPVHPSAGHQNDTLANGLVRLFQLRGIDFKIRPVNRLDKDTSGVVLFAKNAHAHHQFHEMMKEKEVYKEYLGIVHGAFEPLEGSILLPIARKPGSVMERIIDPQGDMSITHYSTLKTSTPKSGTLSLMRFILETGRTHQIRVHCKASGHPILGDWLYSDIPTDLIHRQALHASRYRFTHPIRKTLIEIHADLPEDMARLTHQLINP